MVFDWIFPYLSFKRFFAGFKEIFALQLALVVFTGIAVKNVANVRMVQYVNQATARVIVYQDGMVIRASWVSGILLVNVRWWRNCMALWVS